MRSSQAPIPQQFVAVDYSPVSHERHRPSRKASNEHASCCDLDFRFEISVDRVEMPRRMVAIIHVDRDTVEEGNSRHAKASLDLALPTVRSPQLIKNRHELRMLGRESRPRFFQLRQLFVDVLRRQPNAEVVKRFAVWPGAFEDAPEDQVAEFFGEMA